MRRNRIVMALLCVTLLEGAALVVQDIHIHHERARRDSAIELFKGQTASLIECNNSVLEALGRPGAAKIPHLEASATTKDVERPR
jgi:metallophosphoesterase superfamily enzyme